MKRILTLALTFILVCAFVLPTLASCDLFGNKVWFFRKDGNVKYYISFDEKEEKMLVVVVEGKEAESFTFSYEIDDDEIKIKDSAKNKSVFSYKEKEDSYVVIDGVKFKIADEGPDDYDEGDREFTVYELLGKLGKTVLSGTYTATNSLGENETVVFGADGSITVTVSLGNGGYEIRTGTYELKENSIVITMEGEESCELSYSYESGKPVIDGVEYTPKKNTVTIKPQDPARPNEDNHTATNEPSYTVHPTDDPHYTTPDYTVDNPGEEHPDDDRPHPEIGTAEPTYPSNSPFEATYQTNHIDDGIYYRWIFLDNESWILYEMYENYGEEIDYGTYYFRKETLIISSDFSGNIDFEIDNFNVTKGFAFGDVTFYYAAPHADYPTDSGKADSEFIGTYMVNDDDGDAMTYMLVFDKNIYSLYYVSVSGNGYTELLDEGSYKVSGDVAILDSKYNSGWDEKAILMNNDAVYFEGWYFMRTSSSPVYPKK